MLTAALLVGLAADPGLRWSAPPSCPTRAEAAAYLRDELQQDPEAGSDEVRVEVSDNGWRATIILGDGDARELEALECEDLMAAAMVVISVARAEPDAHEGVAAPEPLRPRVPLPDPAPDDTADPRPPRVTATRRDAAPPPEPENTRPNLTHWLSLNAGVAAALLPSLSARITPRYELTAPSWALRVAGHYDTPRELLYPGDTVGGRFQAASADLSGCWLPGRRAVTGSLCAGLGGGGVFGVGVGIATPRRPRAAWLGAVASAGIRWTWAERWRLAVDVSANAGIRRPLFHVGDRETLFQSPLLGGAGTVGIARRLP